MCSMKQQSQGALASHYALQVALKTMKDRCLQLQARLSIVEQENLKLKTEKQKTIEQEKISLSNFSDIEELQEQVIELSKQKIMLSEHIHVVTTENKHLWSKLSALSEVNESLGFRLNRITSILRSHVNECEQSKQEMQCESDSLSLEEISMKLTNDLQNRKLELEQQCIEMTKIQEFNEYDFPSHITNLEESSSGAFLDNENLNWSEDLMACKDQLLTVLSNVKNQNDTYRKTLEQMKVV